MNALKNQGVPPERISVLLGNRIINSIPLEMVKEWTKDADNDITDIDMVMEFLLEGAQHRERTQATVRGVESSNEKQPGKSTHNKPQSAAALLTTPVSSKAASKSYTGKKRQRFRRRLRRRQRRRRRTQKEN